MSVDKTIKLTRSNDESITVSSGTDTFTIAFFEVPRVSDNAERRFQRVRKPRKDVNETKENSPGRHNFRFTIYGSPTEDDAKDKKHEKQGSRSHFLAIKDDKAFAICMVGDCKESAFKIKVWVGGVNVLQHTTHGKKSQDYFVVSEQKWIWGKQVGEDTARQFRVLRRGRERLSLRYQLRKNNIKKEVEIEITSRRLDRPTSWRINLPPPPPRPLDSPPWSYFPPAHMTSDGLGVCATYVPSIMPQQGHHSIPPSSSFDTHHIEHFSYDDSASSAPATIQELSCHDTGPSTPYNYDTMPYGDTTLGFLQEMPLGNNIHVGQPHYQMCSFGHRRTPLIHMSGPPSPADPTEVVIPLCSNDSSSSSQSQQISQALTSVETYLYSSDGYMSIPLPLFSPRSRRRPPGVHLRTPTEPGHGSPSPGAPPFPPPPAGDTLVLRPPSPVESSELRPPPPPSLIPRFPRRICVEAALRLATDQESIHSDPEEDMLPHQMVVGTGGLIEQIVCPDKHPEWIDDDTVTLKFKIVDDLRYLPKHLQNLEEPEDTAVGGTRVRGTGPGGNYREVPNPPIGTFQALALVVADPSELRRDIRSPMEMELSVDGYGEPLEPPEDSGNGSVGEPEEGGRETDEGEEEGDAREFRELKEEAENQPRGFMNDLRMKKKRREQRKRGGMGIMAEKREDPKSERSSRWRRFVDSLRRVLTVGR